LRRTWLANVIVFIASYIFYAVAAA